MKGMVQLDNITIAWDEHANLVEITLGDNENLALDYNEARAIFEGLHVLFGKGKYPEVK